MVYNKFQDLKLSSLGFGTMRLPLKENSSDPKNIDEEQAGIMFDYAIKNGINYFDTAFGYHDGNSEIVTGKCLNKYPRESFYLASKFPGYDLSNMEKVEEIFEKQLEKCQTPYFDFYLFHNVYEKNVDYYLDEKYGILEYLLKQKENGRIKHLGFSCHGSIEVMKKFLDKYGKYMEFCQIQLNYLDYEFQEAKLKIEMLNELNIPIWVMEPLRGGKLAKLPEEYEKILSEYRKEENCVSWAFRYLQTIPGVTVILSGMSNLEQLKENIEIFNENKPLNENEIKAIEEVRNKMLEGNIIPCTGCKYCTAYCPKGINIPYIISLYNEHKFSGGGFLAPMKLSAIEEDKRPSACLGCKSCEAVCPQQIKISEVMKKFNELGF